MEIITAAEIAAALDRARFEGRALIIVTRLADGAANTQLPRLLVDEDGCIMGGALGSRACEEIAARYARFVAADDRLEITVAGVETIIAALDDADREFHSPDGIDDIAGVRLLFEVSRPPLELIVCGGGHVGRATAIAARMLDFSVTVIDDRAEFVSRERLPDPQIRLLADDFTRALQGLNITPASHVVIVTRGHRHDEICLREVVDKPARYIGMIGSRRRTTTIREHMRREGVAAEHLRRVHAPIGLDIGAQTPEEIALAILAEIVLVRRGGSGRPKSAEGPMAHAR